MRSSLAQSRKTTARGCTNFLKKDVKLWENEDSNQIELSFPTKLEGHFYNKFRVKSNILECLKKLKGYETDNIFLFPDIQVNVLNKI